MIREGERAHDLVVSYAEGSRSDRGAVERVPVPISRGGSVPLAEVADVSIRSGAARIYREESKRYVAVTFSVRGRDMGSAVAEAQARVARAIPPPAGYEFEWGGEFQSAQRATRRLTVVVPITILLIFALLSMLFRRLRESTLVLLVVLITSPVGGMAALWMTGLNFSVSSAVGFLALFGVSVQTGVILVSYMNERRAEGMALDDAILEACDLRLRPVMMTALVASLGLLPAALSTDIGSDSQRPLAVVIVGGLVSALALSLVLLPTFYRQFAGGVSASSTPLVILTAALASSAANHVYFSTQTGARGDQAASRVRPGAPLARTRLERTCGAPPVRVALPVRVSLSDSSHVRRLGDASGHVYCGRCGWGAALGHGDWPGRLRDRHALETWLEDLRRHEWPIAGALLVATLVVLAFRGRDWYGTRVLTAR